MGMKNPAHAGWIPTSSGVKFFPMNPVMSDIRVADISHGLSNICRFTGQVSQFYSVAQHSFLASFVVPEEYAMAALLHDGSEAYLSDVSSPVKRSEGLAGYRVIEERLQNMIYRRFGVDPFDTECFEAVKYADALMLSCEFRALLPNAPDRLDDEGDFDHVTIFDVSPVFRPWTPEEARSQFLTRFAEIVTREANMQTSHNGELQHA